MFLNKYNIEAAKLLRNGEELSGWRLSDEILAHCFGHNRYDFSEKVVVVKVALVNQLYNARLFQLMQMVSKIVELGKRGLKQRMQGGDLKVVQDIADIAEGRGKKYYSFASKFCCFENNNAYPIFDKYALLAVKEINGGRWKRGIGRLGVRNTALSDYETYAEAVKRLQESRDFSVNFKNLDEYLWLYGQWLALQRLGSDTIDGTVREAFKHHQSLVKQLAP